MAYAPAHGQTQTVGLFINEPGAWEGYTLFTPRTGTDTYLIDNYGRVVHTWASDYVPSASVYLMDDGSIMRSARIGTGGGVQKIAWDGTVEWEFPYSGVGYGQHHDIEPLPNGNVLLLCRETKTEAEAIAAGRDPALIYEGRIRPEYIIEVQPTGPTSGTIVWEWYFWDHIIQDYDSTKPNYGVVADHPELLDLNYPPNGRADWIHSNSIQYNAELDQIIISSLYLNELHIIDHSTTTAEAAGHTGGDRGMGGDFLYRWGNPESYRAGTAGDAIFYRQHDAQWVADGLPGESNILIYNNGMGRPGGDYSTIEEFVSPVDEFGNYPQPSSGEAFDPPSPSWTYTADPPESFYSEILSGAQRLPNGNTLIGVGAGGWFFEIDSSENIVWSYVNPVSSGIPMEQGDPVPVNVSDVFRCKRYAPDHPGLVGRDLSPGGQIEIYPVAISGAGHSPANPMTGDSVVVTATITADIGGVSSAELYVDTGSGYFAISMADDGNHHDGFAGDDLYGAVIPLLWTAKTVSYYINAVDGAASTTNDPPNAPDIKYAYVVTQTPINCGDATGDGEINVGDAVFLINYVFKDGTAPNPLCQGKANGDGDVNIGDAVYLITYIFKGGAAPAENCCP